MKVLDQLKMDKTAFAVTTLTDIGGETNYWLSKTPYDRLQTVEILRQLNYGYDQSTARLQRVLEITERPQR